MNKFISLLFSTKLEYIVFGVIELKLSIALIYLCRFSSQYFGHYDNEFIERSL